MTVSTLSGWALQSDRDLAYVFLHGSDGDGDVGRRHRAQVSDAFVLAIMDAPLGFAGGVCLRRSGDWLAGRELP